MNPRKMPKIEENSFKNRVLAVVRAIPKGRTMTYQEVAAAAGSPGAFRAVGSIMSKNFDVTVPCHRVVKSDGTLGGYNRRLGVEKSEILKQEGALV
jgi:methylated-DNA-[protein]-cysteine S-methyltransferase